MSKDKTTSPTPLPVPGQPVEKPEVKGEFPICPVCKFPVEQVQYLDYAEVRVVFHSGPRCVLGVMNGI